MVDITNPFIAYELHQQRIAESERNAEKRRLLEGLSLPKRAKRRQAHLNRPEIP